MRSLPWLLAAGFAALVGCGGTPPADEDPGPPPAAWTADGEAVVAANNQFALDLSARLAEKPGNLFFSPFSGHVALSMTAAGARGDTLAEMRRALHLPADGVTDAGFAQLLPRVAGAGVAPSRRGYELRTANAVWAQQGFPWRPEFTARLGGYGTGAFRDADFIRNPESERRRINEWAEQETNKRIAGLLPEQSITTLTRMVLANAVYFKGEWAQQFDKKRTYDGAFRLAHGGTRTVPLMTRTGGFRWYREPERGGGWVSEFEVVELPYKGDQVSMVIVLPGKPDGLSAVAKKVTPAALAHWLSQAGESPDAAITLPKFRIETESESWKEPLMALGMVLAFDRDRADFRGMHTGGEQLYVSNVFHKAFVDVNEEGTEAAAATAVVVNATSARPSFVADRPFLFLIRHKPTNAILFVGRVTDPAP